MMGKELRLLNRSFLLLAWDDIMQQVDDLASKIEKTYAPDMIIGILRGGLFVANLLSDILGIDEVHPLGLKSYRGVMDRGEVTIYHWPKLPPLNERAILLVDDVSDEGKTLQTALSRIILPLSPKTVRAAVLHIKPWTTFRPDYYVMVTGSWILYPWSRYESWRQLTKELDELSREGEEASTLISILGISRDRALRLLREGSM